MGQFTPRIVGSLLRDRPNQLAIGLFGATFVYALLGLRAVEVPVGSGEGSVPGLTVIVAIVLVLASVVALILYVHHSGRALRATGLIDLVGDDLHDQLHRRSPPLDRDAAPGQDRGFLFAPEAGVVTHVHEAGLVAVARAGDCVLEVVPAMGDFVPAGGPVLRVRGGDPERLDRSLAGRLVALGPERTHDDDPAYGFRCLVDIAERALAAPFEDPSTAVQAIDRLHECPYQLAARPFPSGRHRDEDGHLRLVTPTVDWGYVRLSFDEIRLAGAGWPQVTRRLAAALEDLKGVASPERQAPLERQLRLLRSGAQRAYDDPEHVEAALTPDAQGIGSGDDLLASEGTATPSSPDGRTGLDGGGLRRRPRQVRFHERRRPPPEDGDAAQRYLYAASLRGTIYILRRKAPDHRRVIRRRGTSPSPRPG